MIEEGGPQVHDDAYCGGPGWEQEEATDHADFLDGPPPDMVDVLDAGGNVVAWWTMV